MGDFLVVSKSPHSTTKDESEDSLNSVPPDLVSANRTNLTADDVVIAVVQGDERVVQIECLEVFGEERI